MNTLSRKSLQLQFIIFTGILILIITIFILYSRALVSDHYQVLSSHSIQASKLLNKTNVLRDHVNTVASVVDVVMLHPEYKEQIEIVFTPTINEIYSLLRKVASSPLVAETNTKPHLDDLKKNVNALNQSVLLLFEIRSDARTLYPSIAISTDILRPASEQINSIFELSLAFEEDKKFTENERVAYELLVTAQHLWIRMISEYRLYLSYKLGSFSNESVMTQEYQVTVLFDDVSEILKKIILAVNNNNYSFEVRDQLLALSKQSQFWKEGFDQVVKIHNSMSWRRDAYLMRETILPLVGEIIFKLSDIDKAVKEKNQQYVQELRELSQQQSFFLIIIAIIFVAYGLILFVFLKRLIFDPLRLFSESIRSDAFNLNNKELISLAHTKETWVLIDSFIQMNQLNIKRRDELSYQAMHDSLTGLPNRKALLLMLDQALKNAARSSSCLSFLMLDLNGFKDVNDTLGHHVGDQLLIKVGAAIKDQLRDVDMVARLGGDEFSVVLPNVSKEDAVVVTKKINKALAADFKVAEYVLHISASIGITEYPIDGNDTTVLMQHADIAMYNCKNNKTDYSFYDASKDGYSLQRLALTKDLKTTIKNKDILVYYQPKLSVMNMRPIGCEALLRWKHPEMGFVSPEKIIEIAEGSGLVDDLTFLIIDKAMKDHADLKECGYNLNLAINLSVHNLRNENFVAEVSNSINKYSIDPNLIIFEITESAMMADPEKSIAVMENLTELGVKLSVDDFGTGFSSLSYLKKLPVSELKIDRSFVNDIATDQSDKVIVQSTIDLGHNLGLTIVAEGVEDKASMEILQALKCDSAQGYYFSKPLAFEQLKKWLKNYNK